MTGSGRTEKRPAHAFGALAILAIVYGGAVLPARASIPPSYRVLVVSNDREAIALSEALVQYMSAAQAFFRVQPTVSTQDVRRCLEADDFGACVRPLVPQQQNWQEPAHVIIKVERVGQAGLSWVCVGSGKHRAPTAEQIAEIDARSALFAEGEVRTTQLRAAMYCIQSAAAESVRP